MSNSSATAFGTLHGVHDTASRIKAATIRLRAPRLCMREEGGGAAALQSRTRPAAAGRCYRAITSEPYRCSKEPWAVCRQYGLHEDERKDIQAERVRLPEHSKERGVGCGGSDAVQGHERADEVDFFVGVSR